MKAHLERWKSHDPNLIGRTDRKITCLDIPLGQRIAMEFILTSTRREFDRA